MRERVSFPELGPMRIELDKKALFALASETRLEILKALQPMRRTVSQLSEALNIDKAAVHRHLKKMEEGGLVKRYEDHGFVYYGLTWKARDLLAPDENTKIVILISATWLLLLGALLFLVAGLMATHGNDSLYELLPTASPRSDESYDLGHPYHGVDWTSWALPALAFGAAAIATAVLALVRLRRPLQRTSQGTEFADGHAQKPVDKAD